MIDHRTTRQIGKMREVLDMFIEDYADDVHYYTLTVVLLRIIYGRHNTKMPLRAWVEEHGQDPAIEAITRMAEYNGDTSKVQCLIDAIRYLVEELDQQLEEFGETVLPWPYKGVF